MVLWQDVHYRRPHKSFDALETEKPGAKPRGEGTFQREREEGGGKGVRARFSGCPLISDEAERP